MNFLKDTNSILLMIVIIQINLLIEGHTVKKSGANTTSPPITVEEVKEKKELNSNIVAINSTVQEDRNTNLTQTNSTSQNTIEQGNFPKNIYTGEDDLPESFRTGFYILMSVGLIGLCFIIYKAYRLRLTRAERQYGVQGDRSAQELTPLPVTMDEDSDNEDQTLYELKRPINSFSQQ